MLSSYLSGVRSHISLYKCGVKSEVCVKYRIGVTSFYGGKNYLEF